MKEYSKDFIDNLWKEAKEGEFIPIEEILARRL